MWFKSSIILSCSSFLHFRGVVPALHQAKWQENWTFHLQCFCFKDKWLFCCFPHALFQRSAASPGWLRVKTWHAAKTVEKWQCSIRSANLEVLCSQSCNSWEGSRPTSFLDTSFYQHALQKFALWVLDRKQMIPGAETLKGKKGGREREKREAANCYRTHANVNKCATKQGTSMCHIWTEDKL